MEPHINFVTQEGHRFLDLKSDFGDLHRIVDDLNFDEGKLENLIIEKIQNKEISSLKGVNILIDKYI